MSPLSASNSIDAPLPVELAGRHHGWFNRYRRYPVFGTPWVKGRLKVVLPLALLIWVAFFVPAATLSGLPEPPIGGLVQTLIVLTVPALLGPWLALQVRRRGWDERREWQGLLAAMAATLALMLAFGAWGTEPLKQWIAERTGAVDASGKRTKVRLAIGVFVANPGRRPAEDALPDPETDPSVAVVNALALAALTLWLAGGMGLASWRRERAGLAALERERELQRAQALRHEAEMRLSVLAAQVEPHFLFNTLAGVRSAITSDPERAAEMIDLLVAYLRAAIPRLRSDGRVQATLGAQLDIARAYLGLTAARMSRLRWEIDAPDTLLAAPFPPLMLISLVENAVKHGVERKVGPTRIELRARAVGGDKLEVAVLDDGPGFAAAAGGSGIGLANIRERLQQLHGERARLTLRERPTGGVEAVLSLPLETDNA